MIPSSFLKMSLSIVFWISFFHILFRISIYSMLQHSLHTIQLYHRQIVSLKTYCRLCTGIRFKRLHIAPTEKLASKYAIEHPMCRCNTVHTNYFIPVGNNKQRYAINWGLSDVHVLLVDEVIKFSHIIVHTCHKYQY